MKKKIKKALLKIANEIIDLDKEKLIDEEEIFHKVGQLNEVLSVYRFLKKNKINNWEIQENKLNSILDGIIEYPELNMDFTNDDSKLEVEPLIEKIKDIVTEMPEKILKTTLYQKFLKTQFLLKKKSRKIMKPLKKN